MYTIPREEQIRIATLLQKINLLPEDSRLFMFYSMKRMLSFAASGKPADDPLAQVLTRALSSGATDEDREALDCALEEEYRMNIAYRGQQR